MTDEYVHSEPSHVQLSVHDLRGYAGDEITLDVIQSSGSHSPQCTT